MQNRLVDRLRPQILRHPRLAGVLMMAFGVGMFWWTVYCPYLDALAHRRIWLAQVGMGPSLVCPVFVLCGLAMMLFGPSFLRVNASTPAKPPTTAVKVWATLATFLAWAVLSAPFCAIMGRIEALGYDVGSNPVYYVSRHTPPLHWLAEMTDRLIP